MRGLASMVATCLGIGYVVRRGAGSIAAAVGCLAWWAFQLHGLVQWMAVGFLALLFLTGVWSASVMEKFWGRDHNRVVVDELLGMGVSLLFLPPGWKYILAAFLIFRFFDIAKPLYIKKTEELPSGWGVMTDDLLAGIYTNLLLQLAVALKLW